MTAFPFGRSALKSWIEKPEVHVIIQNLFLVLVEGLRLQLGYVDSFKQDCAIDATPTINDQLPEFSAAFR